MASAFGSLAEIGEGFVKAAIDPTRWKQAMGDAAKATGSFGAILIPFRGRTPTFPVSESLERAADDYVRAGWIHRDPRTAPMRALLHRGVAVEYDFTTDDEIALNPYYQEFLSPHKLRWFAGVVAGQGESSWVLSLNRTIAQGAFTPGEIRRLVALSQRLAGAAELASALSFARIDGALQAFEASGSAVAMIDRRGEVLRLNCRAERLVGPDLQVVRRRIVSQDRDATAALDRALHALLWSREPDPTQPAIVLPRRERRPILAYPVRAPRGVVEGFSQCEGFVVFVDLENPLTALARDLRRVFAMTAAEARLATGLLAGASLESFADEAKITYETARNVLKSIFRKTGAHRQGELIALIARTGWRREG
jgi:DNA-binding CsgD family transcriptional regulator